MNKPLLIYDGDCNFCKLWIDRWKQMTNEEVEYEPYQTAAEYFPDIPQEKFTQSVQLVTTTGENFSGAHAVFRSLAVVPNKRWMLWMYEHVPTVAPTSELCYRFVARHRNGFYKLIRLLWGKHFEPPAYTFTSWLFLRCIGLVYFVAFLSLGTQIVGLVGKNGILPVQHFLQMIQQNTGSERYWEFPTLVWLNSSDAFLQFLCWGGAALSVLFVAGIAPAVTSILLWIFYLSLYVAGQTFLSFQWDILLLETGFLTICLAPFQFFPTPSRQKPPSTAVIWLFRLLLFRLMFFSGFVKLASGDSSWRNLTTLTFHYETQPLPTPIAWYAHQLPLWFHTICCVVMFGIELGVPLLIFMPRRLRLFAFWSFLVFMILIIITGNYTFFNFLAIALCILLLDDIALKRFFPKHMFETFNTSSSRIKVRRLIIAVLAVVILFLNGFQFVRLIFQRAHVPQPVIAVLRTLAPFSLVNHYGLFAVMTNPRYEIVIEGSNDAVTWLEYGFKYKPGDINRSPPWVAPHQPRLDWQMWFAALSNYQSNPWFVGLCVRLLQGAPEALDLLEKNPFQGQPPRYIRAVLYEYHFADSDTHNVTGAWWRREVKGEYLQPISLR